MHSLLYHSGCNILGTTWHNLYWPLSRRYPWKSEQKWHSALFDFKKWRPTFAQKQIKTLFGRHSRKGLGLHDLCGWKLVGKSRTRTLGAKAEMAQWWSVRLPIGRLGAWSTATEGIAVALLGKERSPQAPWQGANFRLRPAANCRHQK